MKKRKYKIDIINFKKEIIDAYCELVKLSFYTKKASINEKAFFSSNEIHFLINLGMEWMENKRLPEKWTLSDCEIIISLNKRVKSEKDKSKTNRTNSN